MQDTIFTKTLQPGEIELREGKRGIEFWAYNLERGQLIHVGTQRDQVYEKEGSIFRQWQTLNIPEAEFSAILETGARFINIVVSKRQTYSIEVERFARYAKPYSHRVYGRQLACPLQYFQFSSKAAPRNDRRDNPPLETPQPIAPREKSKRWERLLDR